MFDESPTNAMVEFARRRNDYWNACAEAPAALDHFITDDWTMDDRRSGGASFGRIDASGWGLFVSSAWEVGEGRPRFSIPRVVATRDERCAAMVHAIEFESGLRNEFILCLCLDPELRREQRSVAFDLEDVDAAVAELDRMNADIHE